MFKSLWLALLLAIVITLVTTIGLLYLEVDYGSIIMNGLVSFLTTLISGYIIVEFLVVKKIAKLNEKKEQEIEDLKELEVFRREFLADISHELKTSIFAAQGFVHTLIDGAVKDKKHKQFSKLIKLIMESSSTVY